MGLDMYLNEVNYVGHFKSLTESDQFGDTYAKEYETSEKIHSVIGGINPISESGSVTVRHTIAYWRKANAIHKWFVDNVQGGEDDCRSYEFGIEALEELLGLCKEVLDTKDSTRLLPQGGFFFGSTEVDGWYWEDIQNTIDQLTPIIKASRDKNVWFEYQASW